MSKESSSGEKASLREKEESFYERIFLGFNVLHKQEPEGVNNYIIEYPYRKIMEVLSGTLKGTCGVTDSLGNKKPVISYTEGKEGILLTPSDLEKITKSGLKFKATGSSVTFFSLDVSQDTYNSSHLQSVQEPETKEKAESFCERIFLGFTFQYTEEPEGTKNYIVKYPLKKVIEVLSAAVWQICDVGDSLGNMKPVESYTEGKFGILFSSNDLEKISKSTMKFKAMGVSLTFEAEDVRQEIVNSLPSHHITH
ncbi:MAG: hypothetical protein K0R63_1007 [Rickettsiales bacterium]|jgi:hypothetical protein|nr:hypothetical protein [Rickettsiales bacterium]